MATTKATTLAHTLGGIAGSIETAEINRLDGLTGDIQTQLDLKAPIASPTLSGTPNLGSNPTVTLGSNAIFPAGNVLQVVTSHILGSFNYTCSGTKFDNGTASTRLDDSHGSVIDDLGVTLTTKKANSKFLVLINLNNCSTDLPASGYPFVLNVYSSLDSYADPIVRGEQSGSNRQRFSAAIYPRMSANTYQSTSLYWSCEKTSSVAKNTSVTFKSCVTTLASQPVYVNYMHDLNTDSDDFMRTVSSATVFEVAT